MGVKFGRDYGEIIQDLTVAIGEIDRFYQFFEISPEDWDNLDEQEQHECARTLADDVFYGLGAESTMQVGEGHVAYDKNNHIIKVHNGANLIRIIKLV